MKKEPVTQTSTDGGKFILTGRNEDHRAAITQEQEGYGLSAPDFGSDKQ